MTYLTIAALSLLLGTLLGVILGLHWCQATFGKRLRE